MFFYLICIFIFIFKKLNCIRVLGFLEKYRIRVSVSFRYRYAYQYPCCIGRDSAAVAHWVADMWTPPDIITDSIRIKRDDVGWLACTINISKHWCRPAGCSGLGSHWPTHAFHPSFRRTLWYQFLEGIQLFTRRGSHLIHAAVLGMFDRLPCYLLVAGSRCLVVSLCKCNISIFNRIRGIVMFVKIFSLAGIQAYMAVLAVGEAPVV